MTGNGRLFGKGWEQILEKIARSNGLVAIYNGTSCRILGPGRVQVIKGNLDFHIFGTGGKMGFFDAKTFDAPHFTYSEIADRTHQLERAVLYNNWGIPAGFLVWFRPLDSICFYSGHQIAKTGPGNRFLPGDGLCLGKLTSFSLRPILGL